MNSDEPVSGFAFHAHHDTLWGWCTDYAERQESIRIHKPIPERALRLRLFALIPKGVMPPAITEARDTYIQALAACEHAMAAYGQARADCADQMEALHARLCPGCPWDGVTIFPEATKK